MSSPVGDHSRDLWGTSPLPYTQEEYSRNPRVPPLLDQESPNESGCVPGGRLIVCLAWVLDDSGVHSLDSLLIPMATWSSVYLRGVFRRNGDDKGVSRTGLDSQLRGREYGPSHQSPSPSGTNLPDVNPVSLPGSESVLSSTPDSPGVCRLRVLGRDGTEKTVRTL